MDELPRLRNYNMSQSISTGMSMNEGNLSANTISVHDMLPQPPPLLQTIDPERILPDKRTTTSQASYDPKDPFLNTQTDRVNKSFGNQSAVTPLRWHHELQASTGGVPKRSRDNGSCASADSIRNAPKASSPSCNVDGATKRINQIRSSITSRVKERERVNR